MASPRTNEKLLSQYMDGVLNFDRRALDRARISRDPRFDGRFFIAITSTRIYCRPICPSPISNIANVRYYPSAAAAAEAGFRPCLRCRPEAAPGSPAWLGTSAVVRRALRLIENGFLDDDSVDDLAARVGIGPRHLLRLFLKHVGASPLVVAQTRRLHFAKRLLDETRLPITEIAMESGFGSVRRFNSSFQQAYRRAPRDFRRRTPKPSIRRGEDEVVLKLPYRPPYDWEHLRHYLAARALPGVERVDTRGYARTVPQKGGHAVVCVTPVAGEDVLDLRVRGATPGALLQICSVVRRVFDVAADPARITIAFSSDALLAALVRRRPGLRIPGAWDPFECAVRAIVGQQVSVSAGRTLASRLVALIGKRIADGEDGLTHLFPTAKDLATADLSRIGMTGARARAVKELARAVAEGKITFDEPVEQIVSSLTSLPGIGTWTAQYVALRALNEPDAFPASDLVLRSKAATGSPPLSMRALEAMAEAWRPWRGYAAIYVWNA